MPTTTAPLPRADSRRVSEAAYAKRGYGVIPRRDVRDVTLMLTPEGLLRAALANPLRALMDLRGVHPLLSLAERNTLGLLCQPGDFTMEAYTPNGPGEADDETDPDATAALDSLWDTLPQEAGGLDGLLATFITQLLYTGMAVAEAVPGKSGQGIAGLYPVDSLSVQFGYERETGDLIPYQRQSVGMRALPLETTFWREVDGGVGNPYGVAVYAPAFNEILEDLRLTNDLRAAFHQVAWPRLVAAVDYNALRDYALEKLAFPNADKANEWVDSTVAAFFEKFSRMAADDVLLSDSNATIETVEGGKGLRNLEPIMEHLMHRMVCSVGTRPFMLGVTDTTTEAQAREQFKLEALTLERLRAAAGSILVRVANLHLRLLGINALARPAYEPIRTTDALIEAQTDAMQLATAGAAASMGLISMDTVAQEVTGSGLADPERAQEWLDAQTASGAAGKASAGDAGRVGTRTGSLDAIESARQRRAERRGRDQDAETQEDNAEGSGG